jgi:hypothetical protein
MGHKKLELNLDFLGESAPEKLEKNDKNESKDQKIEYNTPKTGKPVSNAPKWIWGTIGVVILIIIIAASSNGNSNTSTNNTDVTTNDSSTAPTESLPETYASKTDSIVPVIKKTKTANELCRENYGSNSFSTGEKNVDGGPVCDCNDGYQWNADQTACVAVPKVKTSLEICQERNGVFATYDSASNSCGCATGYYPGATSQKCVSFTTARDESCAANYPGTSFLKYDTETSKNICDCNAGYDWNNDRTACYTTASFTQSCVSSYGIGAYSTTENGKRVCDCSYDYDWNPQRNMCVTTASINAICERDVGRNSRYAGTSTDGKYNCTEPY